jgi:transposase
MNRMALRGRPGRKPAFRFTEKIRKLVRTSGGGIDWYRYRKEIILPKLIPFARQCEARRPGKPQMIVQDDGAFSHRHWFQTEIFNIADVQWLLWPGNSPDLNLIEACWPYMKRSTIQKGAPQSKTEGVRVWEECWENVPKLRYNAGFNASFFTSRRL